MPATTVAPASPGGTGVYWNGADGNTYVKQAGQNGVVNFGTAAKIASNDKSSGFNTYAGLNQIADPNAPQNTPAPTNSNGSGGSASPYVDKTPDITLNNGYLSAADAQQAAGISSINANLAKIQGGYGAETAANEGNYTNESNSNTNALQGGKQTALVNAARGRQGLLATLSSIGALSGDSIGLANEAVQHGANTDLAGASNTFATNQSGLDNAIGTYRRENQARVDDANASAANDIKAEQAKTLQGKQSAYTTLSGDYAAEGNAARAKSYADQATALYSQIAPLNVPTSTLSAAPAAYTAPTLATYLGNTGGTKVVSSPAPGTTPGSLPGLSAINNITGKKQASGLMVA